jgi:Raf kinase inhibitor-like YbhB/YbcL family protein
VKKLLAIVIIITAFLVLFLIKNNSTPKSAVKLPNIEKTMKITSSVFENKGKIPSKYTCDGENINPPLSFSEVPASTKSLALIVDDPDAPMGTFVHWVLYNIDPKTTEIKENSIPKSAEQGKSSSGESSYFGACPPSGAHHYHFKLYALDSVLNLDNPDKATLEKAKQGHIIEKAELTGLYSKT